MLLLINSNVVEYYNRECLPILILNYHVREQKITAFFLLLFSSSPFSEVSLVPERGGECMNCGHFVPKEDHEGAGEYGLSVEVLGLSHTNSDLVKAFLKGYGSNDKFCIGKRKPDSPKLSPLIRLVRVARRVDKEQGHHAAILSH